MENQHTSDDFIHSITAATISSEVKWGKGSEKLAALLGEFLGECSMLYSFEDFEAGADVVVAGYEYYEGETEETAEIKEGMSLLLVDVEDGEVLHEITDADVDDLTLFGKLVEAIEAQ